MHIKLKINEILSALGKLKQVAKGVKCNPIFSNVYIEAKENNLTLTAMNEVAKAVVTMEADVTESETLCVDASKLYDILSTFKDEIVLEYDSAKHLVYIKKDKAKSQLPTVDTTVYPIVNFKLKEIDTSFDLPSETLKDGFLKASYFTDTNSGILSGVNLVLDTNKAQFCATNGSCCIEITKAIKNDTQMEITLPKQAINCLAPFLTESENINLSISGNLCIFQAQNSTYITRILDGVFPKVKVFFREKSNINFTADKTALKTILERVKVSETPEDRFKVNLNTKGCLMHISSPQEKVEDIISIENQGEDISFTLDRHFLTTVLNLLNRDNVTFELNSPLHPVLFKEDNTRMLIMPIGNRN